MDKERDLLKTCLVQSRIHEKITFHVTMVYCLLGFIFNGNRTFCDIFYDNIAKLQDDDSPQIANFAFHCGNAVYVKCICSLRCFKSPTCRALFCDKFAKLYNDDIRSLVALNLAPC